MSKTSDTKKDREEVIRRQDEIRVLVEKLTHGLDPYRRYSEILYEEDPRIHANIDTVMNKIVDVAGGLRLTGGELFIIGTLVLDKAVSGLSGSLKDLVNDPDAECECARCEDERVSASAVVN